MAFTVIGGMSGSVYLDAIEKAEDEPSSEEDDEQEGEDSIFGRQRYETPQVEFERQLSTAIQAVGQSDDESPDEFLTDMKSDHFGMGSEEPVLSLNDLHQDNEERQEVKRSSDKSEFNGSEEEQHLVDDQIRRGVLVEEANAVTKSIDRKAEDEEVENDDVADKDTEETSHEEILTLDMNSKLHEEAKCLEDEESQSISQSLTTVLNTPEVQIEISGPDDEIKMPVQSDSHRNEPASESKKDNDNDDSDICRCSEEKSGPVLQKQHSVEEDLESGEDQVSV